MKVRNIGLICALGVMHLSAIYAHSGQQPIRILTGGIRHESNTFCPVFTMEDHFNIKRGQDALKNEEWAKFLRDAGVEVVPTLHASAAPFGVVSRSTYEKFKREILDGARKAGRVDGVYLDMHGAMHVEGYEDAQGDLVESLRALLGEETLIAASLDLHANLSPGFVGRLNIATGYRTAPHVDAAETRLRAVRLLLNAIRQKQRPATAFIQVPILLPGEKGITGVEPLRSLYGQLPAMSEKNGLLDASIFVGMAWTDVPRASMSVIVVADSPANRKVAHEEARRLAGKLWERRRELNFDVPTDTIDGAIRSALAAREQTVFITDSGDNITAGAAGDSTQVLDRLLAHRVKDAVLAGIVDRQAVEACVRAGVARTVSLTVGGKLDTFSKSLPITGVVRNLVPGAQPGVARGDAVVQVDGILLVLLSERRSFTSPADFSAVGIDPLEHKIVVVKLGYLFQELRNIAPRTIMALTPGFAYQVVEKLPYKKIRRPIFPLDPGMGWRPEALPPSAGRRPSQQK